MLSCTARNALHRVALQAYESAKDEEGPVEATMLRIVFMRIWWYAWYAWRVWLHDWIWPLLRYGFIPSQWPKLKHYTLHGAEWRWTQHIILRYM